MPDKNKKAKIVNKLWEGEQIILNQYKFFINL